ncbi:Zn(2)-C6 fungal-type domain-containing protein [Mycena sanguinolenta]|uniref:Zn(2)-C6 fungal-type domain-containing protein n=1 Tax=Mycena sanguinolenta TaxID=230812 RepID=A0A8H6XTF8_9AGAR|nr:Zn(2)-C6 fungal-type domain-containing protein [Mycena sanguinolenta]
MSVAEPSFPIQSRLFSEFPAVSLTEPFLYRVICSSSHSAILRLRNSKPPAFFHSAVRHLFLDGVSKHDWSVEDANDILRLCTGVRNFAAIGKFSNPGLLPLLANMQVQRISVCLEVLFGGYDSIDLGHSAFLSITHIDIFDAIVPGETKICAYLPALPALTHLCLNNNVPWDVLQNFLTVCSRLELLVVLWHETIRAYGPEDWLQDSPIRDMRFVATVFGDYWQEWEQGARDLPHFWTMADDFVAQKRCGAIPGTKLTFVQWYLC